MPRRNSLFPAVSALLAGCILAAAGSRLCGYAFETVAANAQHNAGAIQQWPAGTVSSPTQVRMTLQMDAPLPAPAITTLQDGSTSWHQVIQAALGDWNQYLSLLQFTNVISTNTPPATSSASNNNNVFWDNTVYGQSWGSASADAVGITIIWTQTSTSDGINYATNVVETDVLFNSNVAWNSYRGALQNNTSDLRRVALHEFGHVLGLNHPDLATPAQSVAAIMNSVTSAPTT